MMNYERSKMIEIKNLKNMEDLHTIRVQKLLVNVQKVFGRANVTIDFDQHQFFLSYIPAIGRGCISYVTHKWCLL